jgi:hypothetical protein
LGSSRKLRDDLCAFDGAKDELYYRIDRALRELVAIERPVDEREAGPGLSLEIVRDRFSVRLVRAVCPFNKADFDRERSMLEDAISRVEIEATNKHRASETPGAAVGPSDIVARSDTPLPPAHEGETLLARGIRKCLSIIRRSNPA